MTIPQGGRKVKSETKPTLIAQAFESVGTRGPQAAVILIADRMPPDLRAEFVAAVNDRTVPAAGLARAVTARGYKIAEQSISRFRLDGRILA
jgi:hypothetical protein